MVDAISTVSSVEDDCLVPVGHAGGRSERIRVGTVIAPLE